MAHYLPSMNLSDSDLNEAVLLFKQKMAQYIEDEKLRTKPSRPGKFAAVYVTND